MKTSRSFLAPVLTCIAAGALAGATAVACSSSSGDGLTVPPISSPPPNATFPEGTFGGDCTENVYVVVGTSGYAFCDDGTWKYTTSDPASDGYMLDMSGGDSGPKDDGATMDAITTDGPQGDGPTGSDGMVQGGDAKAGDDGPEEVDGGPAQEDGGPQQGGDGGQGGHGVQGGDSGAR